MMAVNGLNNTMNLFQKIADKRAMEQKEKSAAKQSDITRKNKQIDDIYGKSVQYVKSDYSSYNTKEDTIDSVGKTTQKIELSDKAKEYLETIRAKYSDMDIMIANYSSDEEAQGYLNRGTGKINVLIDVETLEKMASDQSIREQYESILDNAGGTFEKIEEELGGNAKYVKSIGVSIDKDGKVNYFSIIDESLVKRDNIKKKEETGAEEKKAKEQKENKNHSKTSVTSTVKANNIEDLIQMIRESVANAKNNMDTATIANFDVSL